MLPTALLGWAVYVAEAAPGQPPAGPRRPLAFAPFLYLEPAHQVLQSQPGVVLSFYLEEEATGQSVAQFFVVPDGAGPGQASSPGQAPFGGVQLAAGVPATALHHLLAVAEATLRQHGQRQLLVRGYPACYDPAGVALLAEVLGQRHYITTLAEENYYLDPTRDYVAHLHPSERRRLRRCHQLGLVPEQEPPLILPWAYDFIAACRHERGQQLSLPLPRVQELFRAFPRQHLLFSVRKPSGEWAALTIAIQVSEQVLYNFYPASQLADNHLSPAVLLHESLHTYARASGLAVVDLGTSTLPAGPGQLVGQPNESLLRFKRHLGGVGNTKLSWQKDLG
ncbi:GNAT family N-acetyltransferase [Hymenobacter sp. HMF4947]|uniref:GNAT family N-acetyltransferase n=1 Tax=Hymenobacter ginkgonis TaxID=2682976 RepID=A0A7K1TFP2_9BACT|nr:GNAT family N-acetyltransferase [Hymenobacter ginkgonis]MVN77216.1 GNAT family N-acetyltransferase [Hymenobacter ginkgonis]